VTLLTAVLSTLQARGVPHALIGAGAMAVHGVVRSTYDLDLLVTDPSVLDERIWEPVQRGGASVDVRRGDDDDPLAGVVRFERPESRALDVIVGRYAWQARAIERATRASIRDLELPVVTASDFVLLKLYAGGPQDAWDIEQILDAGDRPAIVAAVEAHVAELPADSVSLWRRIAERA